MSNPNPPDVRIVHLTGAAFRALAEGDLAAAEATSPVPLSAYLAGPECQGLWRMRSEQCDRNPADAAWVTGIVWDERRSLAVGARSVGPLASRLVPVTRICRP